MQAAPNAARAWIGAAKAWTTGSNPGATWPVTRDCTPEKVLVTGFKAECGKMSDPFHVAAAPAAACHEVASE